MSRQSLNRKVGLILLNNRLRLGLSRVQVASRVNLTAFDLYEIEAGRKSIVCETMAFIMRKVYRPTIEETFIICTLPIGGAARRHLSLVGAAVPTSLWAHKAKKSHDVQAPFEQGDEDLPLPA